MALRVFFVPFQARFAVEPYTQKNKTNLKTVCSDVTKKNTKTPKNRQIFNYFLEHFFYSKISVKPKLPS